MNGLGLPKADPNMDCKKILDNIQKAVYPVLKPYGFKKHGRTFHRFVSGDISQVINFQLGQAHMGQTHLLFVNVGIRVPECVLRSFDPEPNPKKYYHEYECNIRSRLGTVEGKKVSCYSFFMYLDMVEADIIRQIRDYVLPAFEELSSREAILEKRRAYPNMDTLHSHLILLEEAMIYGRWGQLDKAVETLNLYYHQFTTGQLAQKDPGTIRRHAAIIRELAEKLNIELTDIGADQ